MTCKKLIICIFISYAVINLATAQAKFTATIQPQVISNIENAELILTVEGTNNVEEITPPSLSNFITIKGPNKNIGTTKLNNKLVPFVSISYTIKPKKIGKYNFAATTALADGKIIIGNAVQLLVTANAAIKNVEDVIKPTLFNSDFILKKSDSLQKKLAKNLFIQIELSKKVCVVGQPIMATYKLYTRLKSTSNITRVPAFNGFSVVDMLPEQNADYVEEKLNGKLYNVYVLKKVQLYPLQAGVFNIDEIETENTIKFIREEYIDPAYKDAGNIVWEALAAILPSQAILTEKNVIVSNKQPILVKPLPINNDAKNFTGAVGNFTIASTIDKVKFTTNDVATITVTLSGEGNLNLITLPTLPWPTGIDNAEPNIKEAFNTATMPISGTKTYTYIINTANAGNYTFPAIAFSYFNSISNAYKLVSTLPITFTVEKGTAFNNPIGIVPNTKPGKEQFFDTLFTQRWLIIIPIILAVLLALFFWLKKDIRQQQTALTNVHKQPIIVNTTQPEKNYFDATEISLQNAVAKEFYANINNEYKAYLADVLCISEQPITSANLIIAMQAKKMDGQSQQQILSLLQAIEKQHYTPLANAEMMNEIFTQAKAIQQIIQQHNGV